MDVANAAEDYSFLKLSKLEERLQARLPGLDLEIQGIVGGEQPFIQIWLHKKHDLHQS